MSASYSNMLEHMIFLRFYTCSAVFTKLKKQKYNKFENFLIKSLIKVLDMVYMTDQHMQTKSTPSKSICVRFKHKVKQVSALFVYIMLDYWLHLSLNGFTKMCIPITLCVYLKFNHGLTNFLYISTTNWLFNIWYKTFEIKAI